jgi:hypothetical protein
MERKFFTTTNWAPWLGVAFLVSPLIFGAVKSWYILIPLLILCFLPAIIVALTLRGYLIIEANKVKYCYDRKGVRELSTEIPLLHITDVQQVGKSVIIHYDKENTFGCRLQNAPEFVELLLKYNPQIKRITDNG